MIMMTNMLRAESVLFVPPPVQQSTTAEGGESKQQLLEWLSVSFSPGRGGIIYETRARTDADWITYLTALQTTDCTSRYCQPVSLQEVRPEIPPRMLLFHFVIKCLIIKY